MTVRFKICLAVWVVTVACSMASGAAQADVFDTGNGWMIEVTPAMKTPKPDQEVVDAPPTVPPISDPAMPDTPTSSMPVATTPGDDYRRIYNSLPFNRAEYNANPSYRHDSTMEILTGNARHQTIVRHSTTPVVQPRSRPRSYLLPSRYNQRRRGLNHYFTVPFWNWAGAY